MNDGLLQDRLAVVENRLRLLYAQRTADLTDAGGMVSDDPSGLSGGAGQGSGWDPGGYPDGDQLIGLAREFMLDEAEVDLLVCAVLPELSPVCGAAYRMLTGSAHSSRPTVAVALEVLGIAPAEGMARGLLRPGSPLLAGGLMAYENPEATYPERLLRVPDRVLSHLVGEGWRAGDVRAVREAVAQTCGRHLQPLPQGARVAEPSVRDALLRDDVSRDGITYVHESANGPALHAMCGVLRDAGRLPLLIDPDELDDTSADFADMVIREARLLGGAVIVPVFLEADAPAAAALRRLIMGLSAAPLPVLLYGSAAWDADAWGTTPAVTVDVRHLPQRAADPADAMAPTGAAACLVPERLCSTAAPALDRARRHAALSARGLAPDEARRIAHDCALRDLGRLARHVQPDVKWDDLVLPEAVRERLDALTFRIRHRRRVLEEWNLRRGGGRGKGATALFAGESGTGKTMAAEAVAAELGVDLYIVSLPTVVSKYIGETEKNLERIFSAAESLSGVMLFDEADSVFAKRGAVRDSNDRYANLQSGYLLQRLESFDGLAILTTNLRSNMDTAFTRRFDEVIEFESPGPDVRARLWRAFLGAELADRCEIDRLADRFTLAGGGIRAGVETAAFAAAAEDRQVSTEDLLKGIEVEYRKLGRLFDAL